jgi:hypothetical protein
MVCIAIYYFIAILFATLPATNAREIFFKVYRNFYIPAGGRVS